MLLLVAMFDAVLSCVLTLEGETWIVPDKDDDDVLMWVVRVISSTEEEEVVTEDEGRSLAEVGVETGSGWTAVVGVPMEEVKTSGTDTGTRTTS